MTRRGMMAVLLLLAFPGAPAHASGDSLATAPSEPPRAPKRPVVDTYWGTKVEDDYQYLEKVSDPDVQTWADRQNARTRAWLDGRPEREAILERVVQLTHSDSPEYYGLSYHRGHYFAMKQQPPKEQPFVVLLPTLVDTKAERVVVDPNAIDPTGGTSIDWFAPSLDGSYVAVSLSKGGSEDGTLHVYEAATGRALEDVIPGVNNGTAGGSAAWNADGTGFYYTRCPRPGERPTEDLPFYQQIWFHRLGTPTSADTYVLGREFPKIAEIDLSTSEDGSAILAQVSNGDGGEYEYWVRRGEDPWVRVARFEDKCVEAQLGPDHAIYFVSRADAPRKKILRLPPGGTDVARATVVVPETDATIETFTSTPNRIYVIEMLGGPTQVREYDSRGKPRGVLALHEIATMSSLARASGDGVVVRAQSYTTPAAYYVHEAGGKGLKPTALAHHSRADFSDCEVRREFATADDGTKIPVNIILRKGARLDATAPTVLRAYGSYGISNSPYFSDSRRVWIEQGGIVAVANIRGGGEFGDEWHRAANLERKKVSMDDLAACARYLVRRGYTSRERLAIEGGSAGGLLVYGTMVHHPDLMSAVVAHVGYGDVLRAELSPNGEFNTTEFGTVKDERQFHGMLGYSPYHHVQDGRDYPSVMALTGMNDPRVEPWQSFKMVARLQATGSRSPVFLRVSRDSGHGIGTSLSEEDRQLADVYTFLFDQLRVKYHPIGTRGGAAPNP
jgi:prolyl oligopeptidase